MLDSSSLDKALDLAFSFASVTSDGALRGMQLLSFHMGVKPEVIVAGVAGLIILFFMLAVFRRAADLGRTRDEVFQAWPSQGFDLSKVPEAPSHGTIMSQIFDALRHGEKEVSEVTDRLREQLLEKFWKKRSSEQSRRDVNSRHLWRDVYAPVMKLAGHFLISSTTQLTALIDRTVSNVQARLSSFSTARTKSRCSCGSRWQRVAREGWTDNVLSWLGWYPWQCEQCLTCSYFRRRS